ncbi:MAG: chemotaxis protein CheB [Yoonia sp.]|uniref:chemotaxis protein CheB n=1 Tax=Yoonia sp. TaxID=2212373 RepID=UPI003EFAEF01
MTETAEVTLTIIGIGSSAGGLEAIRQLVDALPADAPVSYVVVQHMSPHHKSLMTQLVARDTELQVRDVEDGQTPQRNTIYITPPRTDIIFMDGQLRLVEPSQEAAHPKPSVDRFLMSLAQEHGEKSMAIILSGTGRDGAYGVQAIREVGGITIAQDNESAKYDGMPQSAIMTGCVDLILSPPEIGRHLENILNAPRDFATFRSDAMMESPTSDLLQILLARTRVDFRDYKQTTIGRRIERRMVALNIQSEEEYTQFCRANPSAVDALFKDLLISVTRFFRDREAFRGLENLLPELVAEAKDQQLRIWIAGCATGEEAYSIAMLICEALDCPISEFQSRVQIFATDIDRDALQLARTGIYGLSALDNIPSHIAAKYLVRQDDGVRVVDSLRRAILFSDHNVCQDPPFQRIDLLCCRNLLIYFGNTLQKKVLGRFHYAMKPNGLLFLGTAESVAGSDELFVQDRKAINVFHKRVMRKTDVSGYSMPNLPSQTRDARSALASRRAITADRQMLNALARSLGDDSILVSDDFSIAQVYGDISEYISLSQGSNLRMHTDLLRSPLREEARSLITIAFKSAKQRHGVRHLLNEAQDTQVQLHVYPMIADDINERVALLVFERTRLDRPKHADIEALGDGNDALREWMHSLENEISMTREALQQTIEELETSNEELQSTNEELITVNEELQVTATELTGRTGELTSVLESTPLAIIVTDTAFQISQATGAAIKLFGLRTPLNSPHISQCDLPEGFPVLAPLCNEALQLGKSTQVEFSAAGSTYLIDCSPYFDNFGRILGVTMVITSFPGLATEMETILGSPDIHVMRRSIDGKILRISEAYARTLGTTPSEAMGKPITDFFAPETVAEIEEDDRSLIKNGIQGSTYIRSVIPLHSSKKVWLNASCQIVHDPVTDESSIYVVAIDLTEVIALQQREKEALTTLELLQEFADTGYWSLNIETEEVHWSSAVYKIHRVTPEEHTPKLQSGLDFYHPDDVDDVSRMVGEAMEKLQPFRFTKRIVVNKDEIIWVESIGLPVKGADGKAAKVVGVFKEVGAP